MDNSADDVPVDRSKHAGQPGTDFADAWSVVPSTDSERLLRHPLFGEPAIRTPPATEAYLAFRERMLNGLDGFTLIATQQGMGRRGALRVMREYLLQEFPRLSTFEHVLTRFEHTPSDVRAGLLTSVGHTLPFGRGDVQLRRLANMLEEQVEFSGSNVAVLFLYNAEYVDETVCKVLLDLRDIVRMRSIRLFFVCCAFIDKFAQVTVRLLKTIDPSGLRSLFGSVYYLRALSSVEDYAAVLSEIDTLGCGNLGEMTWGEALLPQAYHSGFRLASQADALSHAIRGNSRPLSVQNLFLVIRNVLTVSVGLDEPGFEIPVETWSQAIAVVQSIGAAYLPQTSTPVLKEGD